jgi:hypothetical protein
MMAEERVWKLRFRIPADGLHPTEEQSFHSEGGFILGLQAAYRNRAGDLVATNPDGHVLTEAALRRRYPPA